MRRARLLGLDILARIGEITPVVPDAGSSPDGASTRATYLGADGAVALLHGLHDLSSRPSEHLLVEVAGAGPEPTLSLVLRGPTAPAQSTDEPRAAAQAPGGRREVQRHMTRWVPTEATATDDAVPALPGDAVVLTASPELLGTLGQQPQDPLVLSLAPCTPGVRRRHVPEVSAQAVGALIAELAPEAGHLRVVADLEDLQPARTALLEDDGPVSTLHDLTFLALQAMHPNLSRPGASALALFLRGDDGQALHPFAGLFSGLFKTVALELPECRTCCVLTTETDLEKGLDQLRAEAGVRGDLPVTTYRRGVRHSLVVQEVPAEPAPTPALDADDVVVAVGGGRGITAELLRQVVAPARPTLYILGSTPLEPLRRELAALGGPGVLQDRAAFLRRRRDEDPHRSVAEITAQLSRLSRAAEIIGNLEALQELVGRERVHYRQVDVLDREGLTAVVDEVYTSHGRVDLLIHAAGINRSAALATKSLEAFREVRAVKVVGYCNLRSAFAGRPPRLWCSFGSFIGLTGQIGEADYASANDFLTTAAAAMRQDGLEEFTIGWTLWDEIGMGAHPVTRAFLAKSGVFTRMSTQEGVAHFAEELHAANRGAGTFHLGDAERAAIEDKLPGFLERSRAPLPPADVVVPQPADSTPGFYLDRVLRWEGTHLMAERLFDEERDGYLSDHSVAGVGTLPGLFVPEIAAEVALQLLPDLRVVGFRDLDFARFLKLVPSLTQSPRRIEAHVLAQSPGAATVRVRISGDVTSHGRVLQRDRTHFEATVVLAADYPEAPTWPGLGDGLEVAGPDPYHLPGAPVRLTGPFVTTRDTRMHPLGQRARYVSPVGPGDAVFSRFVVPSLLLDGLARVAVLDLVGGRYVPVAAPRSIRRIDLYGPGGDVELGSATRGSS